MIDHLREVLHQAEENVAVAYWYFNYQETDLQSPVTVLSSILRQILESLPTLPRTILDAYQQHLKLRKEVTLQTLIQLCADVIGCTMRSYVIIDALDECENARHRSDLLVALRRLSQLPNGRVLVTSREHQSDVSSDLKAATQITIRAHESDLRRYLHEELKHAESMDVISESFAAIIAERIIQKADGM